MDYLEDEDEDKEDIKYSCPYCESNFEFESSAEECRDRCYGI